MPGRREGGSLPYHTLNHYNTLFTISCVTLRLGTYLIYSSPYAMTYVSLSCYIVLPCLFSYYHFFYIFSHLSAIFLVYLVVMVLPGICYATKTYLFFCLIYIREAQCSIFHDLFFLCVCVSVTMSPSICQSVCLLSSCRRVIPPVHLSVCLSVLVCPPARVFVSHADATT